MDTKPRRRTAGLLVTLFSSFVMVGAALFLLTTQTRLGTAAACTTSPFSPASMLVALSDVNCDMPGTARGVTSSVTPTTTVTPLSTPQTVTVEVRNNFFTPDPVTIHVGDTVVWQRVEGFHNVVADDGSFRLGENAAGDPGASWTTVSHTFTQPGSYPYYCEVHGAAGGIGMAGTVTVQALTPELDNKLYLPTIRIP